MRRALLPVLAVTGVVIGHKLAYAIAWTDPTHRASLLRDTGHAYWQAAAGAALIAAAFAATSHVVHAIRRVEQLSLPRAGLSLAALQMVIFSMMEASERVAADQPLTTLFDHHVLVVGLVVQVVVAALLVQVLRLLGRVATAVADAIRPTWSPTASSVLAPRTRPAPAPQGAIGRPCGSRAPPLAA